MQQKKNRLLHTLTKKRPKFNVGFSLIEVLIGVAMMGIVSMGVSSLISSQNKQIKVVVEKMATTDVATRLKMLLGTPNYCSCLFRGLTFDEGTKVWSTAITSFPETFTAVPAFPGACTAGTTFVTNDLVVPGTSMKFDQITLSNYNEMPPLSGHYLVDFEISFKDFIIKPRNIKIPIELSVNVFANTSADRPFTSCSYNGSGAVSLTNCGWTAYGCGAVMCPAGKIQTGMETQAAFNEDCGGGGNDYDEPSRRLYCCEIN